MTCPNCGIEHEFKYCPECGTVAQANNSDHLPPATSVVRKDNAREGFAKPDGNNEKQEQGTVPFSQMVKKFVLRWEFIVSLFTAIISVIAYGAVSEHGMVNTIISFVIVWLIFYLIIRAISKRLFGGGKSKVIAKPELQALSQKDYNNMDGIQFERFCADLLRANGFTNVSITPPAGDFGIDVLAEANGVTYAIQCKRYAKNLGIDSVQQAYSGCAHYKRNVPVVMTNSSFTGQAEKHAKSVGVIMWDGNTLRMLLRGITPRLASLPSGKTNSQSSNI